MKGAFFLGAGLEKPFEIREMNISAPGPKEVLVRVYACGICGTDVHIYKGEKGSADVVPPIVLGHEFAGTVVEVGDEVTLVKPGDHITADPNMYCGICRPCRMGRKQNCQALRALGVNANGGFAEYAVCPESQCFKLADNVDMEIGALTEPLACVVHGIDIADIKQGQTVAVIGAGTIGLLMMQMAKLRGAAKVVMCATSDERCRLSCELGADFSINTKKENMIDKFRGYTGLEGADVVIECVGKELAVRQALEIAGPGARVLLFSVPNPDTVVSLPLFPIFKKELTICGSLINPDTHQRAVEIINSGKIEIKKLITHRFDLEHLEDAVKCQMGHDSIKVIVRP